MISKELIDLIAGRLRSFGNPTLTLEYSWMNPRDTEGLKGIPEDKTACDLLNALAYGSDEEVSDMCGNDTVIRECLFSALESRTGFPYEFFYQLWLGNELKALKQLISERDEEGDETN